jgi:nitroimidazol reductase NimA-like FMN-containing flavoprotein (pyridoxamine 5'-phosphate oxidase superfamily)
VSDSDAKADSVELEEIDEAECWRLLSTRPVGRVAINVGAYPLVFPVNHAVVAHGVVFRTAPGSKLWSMHRSRVSFQVDDLDSCTHTGWSVLVRGSAREITADNVNSELFEIVRAGAPTPWAPGRRDHLVRIVADSISGRRIRVDRLAAGDQYLPA